MTNASDAFPLICPILAPPSPCVSPPPPNHHHHNHHPMQMHNAMHAPGVRPHVGNKCTQYTAQTQCMETMLHGPVSIARLIISTWPVRPVHDPALFSVLLLMSTPCTSRGSGWRPVFCVRVMVTCTYIHI